MPKASSRKQKLTHEALLATTELPKLSTYGGTTHFELPVGQLPEVRKAARAEYKKEQPRLLRRLGGLAVDGVAAVTLVASNPQLYLRSTEQNDRSFKTGEGINFIGRIAAGRLNKMFKRGEERPKRRQAAHERAVANYREQHPEISEHEAKLRSELQKQQEEQYKRSTPYEVLKRGKYTIDYFGDRNVSSFSKAIPRQPLREGQPGFTGDYTELAKQTLTSAITHKTEDGTIPLLGLKLEQERLEDRYDQGQSLTAARKTETEYVEGVSTTLWQLGFVQFKDERSVTYGNGNFNPAIEWEKTHDTVIARIPFDASNELHQILAPDQSVGATPMIELEMSAPDYGGLNGTPQPPYLNMRVAEALVPVAA